MSGIEKIRVPISRIRSLRFIFSKLYKVRFKIDFTT